LLSNTRVSIPKKSFFEVSGTFQVTNVGPGANDGLYTWIAQNGTNVGNTLGFSAIPTSNTVVNRTFMIATNTTSDYVELVVQRATGTVGTVALTAVSAAPVTSASATVMIREV